MQEALHSFNVKFKMQGFECQLTCRDDKEGTGLIISQGQAVVRMLAGLVGVSPTNGNGHAAAAPGPVHPQAPPLFEEEPAQPVCPVCGQADQLELVKFMKLGKPHQALKCQRCSKWLPDKK